MRWPRAAAVPLTPITHVVFASDADPAIRPPPPPSASSPLERASAPQRRPPIKLRDCSQNLDSPLPTTQGLPVAAVSSSSTPYPLHSQQHAHYTSLQPAAGPPLDTAALLRRAQRGAGLLEGIAHGDPLPRQRMQPWQHSLPPPLVTAGMHGHLSSPPWQPPQQQGLQQQQPTSGQTLNGSSTAATNHRSTGAQK